MANLLNVVTDAIVLSHDLSKTYEQIIYEEGVLFKLDPDKLLDIVLDYLKQTTDIKGIDVRKHHNFPSGNVYGVLKIDNNIAQITVNGKLNDCWSRFTICKEILQLYIDTKCCIQNYPSSDIVQQINDLVEAQNRLVGTHINGASYFNEQEITEKAVSEFTAIAMAIDIIFPFSQKNGILSQIESLIVANEITLYDIAFILKMPEFVVTTYYKSFHNTSLQMIQASVNVL